MPPPAEIELTRMLRKFAGARLADGVERISASRLLEAERRVQLLIAHRQQRRGELQAAAGRVFAEICPSSQRRAERHRRTAAESRGTPTDRRASFQFAEA